jgi:hypothetical protein
MVGISGGVPRKVDIRLSDVVVSNRVIKFNIRKAVKDDLVQRTGILKTPLPALLMAVAALRAVYKLNSSKIPSLLSSIIN